MRMVTSLFRGLATVGVAMAVLVGSASMATAFNLRAPQIAFNSVALQTYLNGIPETINVLTDQVNGEVWNASVSGNATFTLMIEVSANALNNAVGIYNTTGPVVPPLFNVFPAIATAGWFATAHFALGNMTVTLFNQNAVIQGQITYPGVNPNGFGFYITGPAGTFYSQDYRNGGTARILTYLGTNNNFGDWWECFEESNGPASDNDFNDVVLLLQSVVPVPVNGSTWGKLKTLYRQ